MIVDLANGKVHGYPVRRTIRQVDQLLANKGVRGIA